MGNTARGHQTVQLNFARESLQPLVHMCERSYSIVVPINMYALRHAIIVLMWRSIRCRSIRGGTAMAAASYVVIHYYIFGEVWHIIPFVAYAQV